MTPLMHWQEIENNGTGGGLVTLPFSLIIDTGTTMIDWITGTFPLYIKGLVSNGDILSISNTGEQEWATMKRLAVTGSYETRIQIRTRNIDENGDTVEVELSGNPIKFLQGHNLWGTCDTVNLVYSCLERISLMLGTEQPLQFYDDWKNARGTLGRVDINKMYSTGSKDNCLQWLYSAANSSRTRSKAALLDGETVYFNRGSRRWSIKMYNKGIEIELPRNNRPGMFPYDWQLKEWAADKLRQEVTLMSTELNSLGMRNLRDFAKIDPLKLFDDYRERITMADQLELDVDLISTLTGAVRGTYSSWLLGIDCRSSMTKPTFYRHRRELLKYGIDISVPKPVNNVMPLVRTIVLEPCSVPDWAHDRGLVYEPKKIYEAM